MFYFLIKFEAEREIDLRDTLICHLDMRRHTDASRPWPNMKMNVTGGGGAVRSHFLPLLRQTLNNNILRHFVVFFFDRFHKPSVPSMYSSFSRKEGESNK